MRPIRLFAFVALSVATFLAASAQTAPTTAPAQPRDLPWIISPDDSKAAPLTPETLETWLADKEIVELFFSGPQMDLPTLPKVLQLPESVRNSFEIAPGETGGGCFVSVRFVVSPETIKSLLNLQASLLPRNFRLDPARANVIAFQANAANRQQARKQLPELLATLRDDLTKNFPGIQFKPPTVNAGNDIWGFAYTFPDTGGVSDGIFAYTLLSLDRINMAAAAPSQIVHLRALGLKIELQTTSGLVNPSPQDVAIGKIFRQAMAPLIDLDKKSLVTPAPK